MSKIAKKYVDVVLGFVVVFNAGGVIVVVIDVCF